MAVSNTKVPSFADIEYRAATSKSGMGNGSSNAMVETKRDSTWVARSFFLAGGKLMDKNHLKRWRLFSDADLSFIGTGLGQNTVINSVASWTPTADIPRKGLWARDKSMQPEKGKEASNVRDRVSKELFEGVGRKYIENHSINKQTVSLRFGTVVYKGMVTFFTSFYDNDSAQLAKYGRVSLGYYAGLLAGTLAVLPLAPLILGGVAFNYLIGRSSSRFADLKPAMSIFWTRASMIYNAMGANLGIVARTFDNTGHWSTVVKGEGDSFEDLDKTGQNAYVERMSKLLPGVFNKDGTVNFFKMATEGGRRELEHRKRIEDIAANSRSLLEVRERILSYIDNADLVTPPGVTLNEYMKHYHGSVLGDMVNMGNETDAVEDKTREVITNPSALEDLKRIASAGGGQTDGGLSQPTAQQTDTTSSLVNTMSSFTSWGNQPGIESGLSSGFLSSGTPATTVTEANASGQSTGGASDTIPPQTQAPKVTEEFKATVKSNDTDEGGVLKLIAGWGSRAKDHFALESKQAAAFINFGVNYTGSSTVAFSNTLTEMSITQTLNGIAGGARNTRVSMMDYNTGFGFVDEAMGMVRNVFAGAADSVQMSGLLALAGNAFIDFPKQWDNSTVTLPQATFTIELRSPYGNDLSQYLNLYPTLAAVLAAALPPSSGPKSYTSPLVCECYSQGLCAIRLGMITDLSIAAGVGNLGYNENRRPLAFDVTFTVTDFSSVMHAPISNGFNPLKPFRRVLDDDNPFTDYLSTITGMHLNDMINPKRKFAIKMAARMADYKAWISPEHVASKLADSGGVRLMNTIFGNSTFPNTVR